MAAIVHPLLVEFASYHDSIRDYQIPQNLAEFSEIKWLSFYYLAAGYMFIEDRA